MALGVIVDMDALARLELGDRRTFRSFSTAIRESEVRNSPPVATIPALAISNLANTAPKDHRTTLPDALNGRSVVVIKDPICQEAAAPNCEGLAMYQSAARAWEPSITKEVHTARPRSRPVLLGVAAGFANLALVLFGFNSLRSIRATEHSPLAVPSPAETSNESLESQLTRISPVTSSLKQLPMPTVAPPVAFGKRSITITAAQGSWIDACPDGKIIFRRYLPERSSVDIPFSNEAVVRLGNAGGLEVSVDGTPSGPLGIVGQTRLVQFDAKGSRFLMPGEPGTECGR